jgi:hypothetical protein
MQIMPSRRDFLAGASMAAAAAVFGGRSSLADEGPPETTTIRLSYQPRYACVAPESISEELLRAEGFTDVRFVPLSDVNSVAGGQIDFDLDTAAWIVSQVDAGQPITGGCASRLLRTLRARAHSNHPRSEGQEGRHRLSRLERALVPHDDGGASRSRSQKRHRMGPES